RYTTAGGSNIKNAQPFDVLYKNMQIALAHNGNIVNVKNIKGILEDSGVVFNTTSDTELILNLFARNIKYGEVFAIKELCQLISGSYALTITLGNKLIGVRDVNGLRPLCIGENSRTYVIASESCALDAIGANFVRDVEPGEIVIIDEDGLHSYKIDTSAERKMCIFEYVYFARPDSVIDGISVYKSRYNAGKIMARENPTDADIVIGVPDSGIPAAIGYAKESGIGYGIGLIKNKYIGRTFIQPSQKMREEGVAIKLNPLRDVLEGKRVIIIDDSIVRGTTSQKLVKIIRDAGAKEVHLRSASPPVISGCYYGVDTPSKEHLIAANMSINEITQAVGADSVGYISLEGLIKATGGSGCDFCKACFDEKYPITIPHNI
ncbi:MAG: amidophosphoribosyltransferase, partial [Eubacteriaceae bacterium]|nr:amidophosphoribosyltransferase [Eubacteriaceae bacterium]